MRYQILFFLCFAFSSVFGSNKPDSLKQVWKSNLYSDTIRLEALNSLVEKEFGNQPDSSYFYSKKLIEFAKEKKAKDYQIKGLLGVGKFHFIIGQIDSSKYYTLKAAYLLKKNSKTLLHARVYNSLGTVYRLNNEISKSIEVYKRAIAIFKTKNDQKKLASTYLNLSRSYGITYNHEQGQEAILNTIAIYESMQDSFMILDGYNNMGVFEIGFENYINARDYFIKSLEISRAIDSKMDIAKSLNNLGIVYSNIEDFNQSIDYYLESIKIKDELGDLKGKAATYKNIGAIYDLMGASKKSLLYLNKAIEIDIKLNYQYGIALDHYNIGTYYLRAKSYDKAYFHLKKCYDIHVKINHKKGLAECLTALSQYYRDTDDHQQAVNYLKKAVVIYLKLEDDYNRGLTFEKIGRIYYEQKNYGQAIQYCSEAIKLIDQKNYPSKVAKATKTLYLSYKGLKNYDKAIELLELTDQLEKEFVKTEKKRESMKLSIKYEFKNRVLTDSLYTAQKSKLKDLKIEQQNELVISKKNTLYLLIGVLTVLFLLIVFSIINYQKKKKTNRIIQDNKVMVETQKKTILEQNEFLDQQKQELKISFEQYEHTQNKLLASEKKASLGTLIAGVALEINNPLNFIHGNTIGLESYIKNQLENHQVQLTPFIEGIKEGLKRTAGIIKSLHQFSQKSQYQKEECDFNTIIDNCILILNHQIKDNITVHKLYTRQKYTFLGNSGKLHQAFINLLIDTVNTIEENGEIIISTSIRNKEMIIEISFNCKGETPTVIPEPSAVLFSNEDKNVSLGLAIANDIIQEHNGKLSFNSEKGVGTTLTISFTIDINLQ